MKALGLEIPDMDGLVSIALRRRQRHRQRYDASPGRVRGTESALCWTGYRESLMPFYTAEDAYALAENGVYGTVEEVTAAVLDDARSLVKSSTPC